VSTSKATISVTDLKIPGKIDEAIEEVQRQHSACGSMRIATDLLPEFIRWCSEAERMFGNWFNPSSHLFVELESSHREARQLAGQNQAPLVINTFLNRERNAWLNGLEGAEAMLKVLKAYAEVRGHKLVLDTSMLMEGDLFTEAKWEGVDPNYEGGRIRLIIPILVIEELDELKVNRDGDRRARARRVIRELWDLHKGAPLRPAPLPKHPQTTIEVFLDDGWSGQWPGNDGEIIAQACGLATLFGDGLPLVTRDLSQAYRSAAVNVRTVFQAPPPERVRPARTERSE
jgi:hypothetical protein